jgi:peptidyl-dipeptidase Dcp
MSPSRTNPLMTTWETPFGMPPFDAVLSEDYLPALSQAMVEHSAEVKQILDEPSPPSFDNTVLALERSGRALRRLTSFFYNQILANTDAVLDATHRELAPRLSAHWSEIITDAKTVRPGRRPIQHGRQPRPRPRGAAPAGAHAPGHGARRGAAG